jgi:hypothetical protein
LGLFTAQSKAQQAAENNKLALAAMLQRQALADEAKGVRQDDQQESVAAKVAAQVSKTLADEELAKERAKEIPLESQRKADDLAFRADAMANTNQDRDAQRELERQIATTKAMQDRDAANQPTATVTGGLLPDVSPPSGATATPGVIPFANLGERAKAIEDLRTAQKFLPVLNAYTASAARTKPEDYGKAQGGNPLGFLGPLLNKFGAPKNLNELNSERVNPGVVGGVANFFMGQPTKDDKDAAIRQGQFKASAAKFKSDYNRMVSGLTVTEQEQARLDDITGRIEGNDFANDPVIAQAAVEEFNKTYSEILKNMEDDINRGGLQTGRRPAQVRLPGQKDPAAIDFAGTSTGLEVNTPASAQEPRPTAAAVAAPQSLSEEDRLRAAYKQVKKANPQGTPEQWLEQAEGLLKGNVPF